MTQSQWATALLIRLGIRPTSTNVSSLVAWELAEGGHWKNDARYNPLNTTQPEPGAGNTGSQGNIKIYRSWDQGLDATATTLKNGKYGGILTALRSGSRGDIVQAIGSSPWGTTASDINNTIGSIKDAHPDTGGGTGGVVGAIAAAPGAALSGAESLVGGALGGAGDLASAATKIAKVIAQVGQLTYEILKDFTDKDFWFRIGKILAGLFVGAVALTMLGKGTGATTAAAGVATKAAAVAAA